MYNVIASQADLNALVGASGRNTVRVIDRLLAVEPRQAATRAAGEAGEGAYVLSDDAGLRRCFVVQADGTMNPALETAR